MASGSLQNVLKRLTHQRTPRLEKSQRTGEKLKEKLEDYSRYSQNKDFDLLGVYPPFSAVNKAVKPFGTADERRWTQRKQKRYEGVAVPLKISFDFIGVYPPFSAVK